MTTTRPDGRAHNALREVHVVTGVNPHAEGSCQISFGQTKVLCTASLVPGVPRWLKGQGKGWMTAEYGMLPRATHTRKDREAVRGKQEGRTVEIQRLIGRSLRAVCDLTKLDGFTLALDCDVLVADGGTRTASITGAYLSAALAVGQAHKQGTLKGNPFSQALAAISCGVTPAGVVLDMDYAEDSSTLADGNFVMAADGGWIEIQTTAEQRPITQAEQSTMLELAEHGIRELLELQRNVLEQAL
ncbi:MAG: ribonuclease PH [Alphaproteobacteria bacterium]